MAKDTGRSLVFARAAARSLSRMPRPTEDLIRQKLGLDAQDPDSLANNVKALRGAGDRYRLRVGDWRAVFKIEADRIIVHAVGPRGWIYG